jgi:hypothetical protein
MTGTPLRRIAVLCLGLVAAAAGAAAPAEPVMLRYRFRPDERLAMRVAHRALTETTMNGTTQSVETMTDSTKTPCVSWPHNGLQVTKIPKWNKLYWQQAGKLAKTKATMMSQVCLLYKQVISTVTVT